VVAPLRCFASAGLHRLGAAGGGRKTGPARRLFGSTHWLRTGLHTGLPRGTGTKADLIAEVERITELKRTDSEIIVETIFDNIIQALQKGDKIEIRGFGSFRTRDRRGRVGRNPKTGAKVEVPPKKIPFFKPSKELKDFVNNSNGAS